MPLTVADLADHMNTAEPGEGTQQRREMQRALDTAVQETTRRTGMLDAVTVTVSLSLDRGDRLLRLPYVRLDTIGVVTSEGLPIIPYYTDPLAGLVDVGGAWTWGVYGGGSWTVTCTGRPWPAALETSALEWAAHLYDTQRARTQPVDDDEPTPSYALPNRVEELQRPYLLAGIA